MKKNIFLFFFLFSSIINSQTIIERLESTDYSVRLGALIEIRDNHLTEYIDILVERVFEQPTLLLTDFFVDVLFILEYDVIGDVIYQFIDVCDQFPQENPLRYKVEATELLVELDDLSTIDYVFEYVNIAPVINGQRFIPLLKDIAVKMPQHSQTIKELFVNIKDSSDSYLLRREVLEDLILLFGENNLHDEILASITNDTDANIRKFAMEHYNFADREDLLKQQIQNDAHRYQRIIYVEDILKNYGQPEDLKFVIDYLPFEPDTNASWNIYSQIRLFIPPKPDTLNWSGLITKLISYTSEMYSYQWIANTQTRDYYISKLNLIASQIALGRYKDACNTLNKGLLAQIEKDLTLNNITTEGYKFLHYYSVYIKEEFPGPLPCP